MLSDLSYALRQLQKSPTLTFSIVLTLALGIGATTAIFSVADAVLLRPLPYPNSERLVLIRDELSKMGVHFTGVSFDTFEAYRKAWCFDDAAAFTEDGRSLIGSASAERVTVLSSTESLPAMLGARTVAGRNFQIQDWNPEHKDVAIISYSLFQRRFAADPKTIGTTIRLDALLYTVIGVMPAQIKIGFGGASDDVWVPLRSLHDPLVWQFHMLARTRPGINKAQVQSAITGAASYVEGSLRPYRGPNGEDGGYTARVLSLRDEMLGDYRTGSILLSVASCFLLLIACVNVANLLLARATTREKETAIRRALGASTGRLLRQWTAEAAVLAAFGGAASFIAGQWGLQLLKKVASSDLPNVIPVVTDTRVLLFTLLTSCLVCASLSLAPALTAPAASLRGPRRNRRTANWLVTAEVTLAVILVIGCGLLGKSLARLQQIDTGLRAGHLLTMQIQLSGVRYQEPRQKAEFFSQLNDRLSALPGVISASSVDRLPVFKVGVDTRFGNPFSLDGRPWNPSASTRQMAHTTTVGLNYFQTMGVSLREGRDFSRSDAAGAPAVAIINETLEHLFFPKGDAVGQRILFGAPSPGERWMTIVGVVSDVRNGALDLPPPPQFFTPEMQDANGRMFLVLRTAGDPAAMRRAALTVVRSLDPEQPVSDIGTMQHHLDETLGQPRFRTLLTSLFGIIALLLSAVGIYGVVSNSVAQRRKEIGIRSALGATAVRIAATIVGEGLRPIAAGIALGCCGGAVLARLLASILYQVKPGDSITFALAILLIAATGVAACLIPALTASRIDPAITLRDE